MQLSWDDYGSHGYSAGVSRGVFYPIDGIGVPWNGLVGVEESIENSGQTFIYIDGLKRANKLDLGNFAGTIEAITYPDEFLPYDGYAEPIFSGQKRVLFNFAYRVRLGNDLLGTNRGYQLHLVYNCMVKPTQKDFSSTDSSSDISTFSWDLSTVPVPVQDARPTSHIIIDSTKASTRAIAAIEALLYGSVTNDPTFPNIEMVKDIFDANADYVVIDNGDGSWTAIGPDEAFSFDGTGTVFTLDWPWVNWLDTDTYQIRSY